MTTKVKRIIRGNPGPVESIQPLNTFEHDGGDWMVIEHDVNYGYSYCMNLSKASPVHLEPFMIVTPTDCTITIIK